jgi:hypothetical protein
LEAVLYLFGIDGQGFVVANRAAVVKYIFEGHKKGVASVYGLKEAIENHLKPRVEPEREAKPKKEKVSKGDYLLPTFKASS